MARQTRGGRSTFAAIDFETADYGRDSACAVAVVRVEGSRVVDRFHSFIRPPRQTFAFTDVHGITWRMVAHAPTFQELWPALRSRFDGVDFLAAHNAPFDASVLRACLDGAGVRAATPRFECTVRIARAAWRIYPTTLPNVCQHLGIDLDHHDPLSDAEACARIVVAAGA